jgi:CRISPR-associated exonuclease Cas4
VVFDNTLRNETVKTAQRLHELISKGVTPQAVYEKKCDQCSMIDICVPKAGKRKSVKKYIEEEIVL